MEDKKNKYTPEPGEETLAKLIKEAGVEARARKKTAMANHFQKLRAASRDISISTVKQRLAPSFSPICDSQNMIKIVELTIWTKKTS